MSICKKILVAATLVACSLACAQELVNITYKTIEGGDARYEAIVNRPTTTQPKKHKAVVILHHAGGWGVGTTQQYAKYFTENGFVTIEPRMFNVMPNAILPFVPLIYSSLKYLAQDTDVDPTQISLMGLSLGGDMTIFSATEWATKNNGNTNLSFAKFAPVYPVCWFHRAIIERKMGAKLPAGFQDTFAKKPLRIFAGSADDYSSRDPADCQNFINAIPDAIQKSMSTAIVYEGATHGWDQGSTSFREPRYGCKGQGCMIELRSNPKVTQQAMKDLLDFFNGN